MLQKDENPMKIDQKLKISLFFYLFGKGNELAAISVRFELELGDTTKLSGLRGNSLLTDVI